MRKVTVKVDHKMTTNLWREDVGGSGGRWYGDSDGGWRMEGGWEENRRWEVRQLRKRTKRENFQKLRGESWGIYTRNHNSRLPLATLTIPPALRPIWPSAVGHTFTSGASVAVRLSKFFVIRHDLLHECG